MHTPHSRWVLWVLMRTIAHILKSPTPYNSCYKPYQQLKNYNSSELTTVRLISGLIVTISRDDLLIIDIHRPSASVYAKHCVAHDASTLLYFYLIAPPRQHLGIIFFICWFVFHTISMDVYFRKFNPLAG